MRSNCVFRKLLAAALALIIICGGLDAQEAQAAYNRPYYIEVDITNQIVTIYNTADDTIARQMLCSSGENDSTPVGTYYLPSKELSSERTKWYYFRAFSVYAQYATRIKGAYLFHSIPFNRKSEDRMSATAAAEFGTPASHGCIRLRVEDAEFIAKQCLTGTRVKIYKSGEKNEELRQLLYISSYIQDEMTYPEFLGISEDALGYGSAGAEVKDLQLRLSDLGYYEGASDGKYEIGTIAAVKNFQKDLGIVQNGIASKQLLEVLFSEDAPISAGQVTLKEGRSGPVVKKLQTALKALGVYSGDLDSVYDVDVVGAVKTFQQICGCEADGVADPEFQRMVYYQLAKVQDALGTQEFSAEFVTEQIDMARVTFDKAKIVVREKMSKESNRVVTVKFGDTMLLLGSEGEWVNVMLKGKKGYMLSKYLEHYTDENTVLQYSAGEQSVVIGNTLEEYIAGADSELEQFKAYYASEQYAQNENEAVDYATVNTGSDDVKLNLREAPDGQSSIYAQIPNGTSMRVLSQQGEWTKVGYAEEIGYLMSQYLTFWQGGADELEKASGEDSDAIEDEDDGEPITAVVVNSKRDSRVSIYAEPDEDSEVLARVKYDVEVNVLRVDEETGWVLVSHKDEQGYMKDVNLSFRLGV